MRLYRSWKDTRCCIFDTTRTTAALIQMPYEKQGKLVDLTPRQVKEVVAELRKENDPGKKTVAEMDLNNGGRVKDWSNAKADRGQATLSHESSLTFSAMGSQQISKTATGDRLGLASSPTTPTGTDLEVDNMLENDIRECCASLIKRRKELFAPS